MHHKLRNILIGLATSVCLTAGTAAASELLSGVEQSLDGARGEEQIFFIEVPAGVGFLRVNLKEGTGDADLFVRYGRPPSRSNFDCRSENSAADDVCSMDSPTPGTWYVMVYGFEAFSDVLLEAFYSIELRNGVPETPLGARTGETLFFHLDLPVGARDLTLSLSGGTGDADLSVFQHLGNGLVAIFPCGIENTNDETCAFDGDVLFRSFSISVSARRTFSGASLTATFDDPTRCSPTATSLCLLDGRFRAEVEWRNFQNETGSGKVVGLGPAASSDSGLFWFFNQNNWEMLVKMVKACGFNDHYWVFAAATTDVEYTLRITDTETGVVRRYFNRLGNAAPALTDTFAFPTCP